MKLSTTVSARLRFCQRRMDNRLIAYTFGPKPSAFVTPFFQSSTLKQRILMLQKSETSRWAVVKYGFVALITFSLFVFVAACEDRAKQDVVNDKEITVSGQILASDGQPIPGANVVLKGASKGTTTDVNGRYKIQVPANGALLVGFVGHKSQEIAVGGKTVVNARLVEGSDETAGRFSGQSTDSDRTAEKLTAVQDKEHVFTVVEKHPEFPGGMVGLTRFINENLRYPEAAQKAHVSGKVFLSFVINTDGSFQDIQVLKGFGFGADEEAIRVLKAMPRWKPATQDGKLVRVKYNLPIKFELEEK
ncbi:TonB family protein [Larkinella humicola]|uniref:TonB family protein n=1 Tax=Larkinella humicola TaxID=2607654 RepID=A0A5N1JHC7_9BACT|nr:TonB family protein [Larkinella humicola]KAA9353738.1 TonB family protein [Larkinella humicola]